MINPYELKHHVPISNKSGIYFLFNKDKIIYIGATKCIARRVGEHIAGIDWKNNKHNFDITSFSYIIVNFKDKTEQIKIEQEYIVKYKPQFNKLVTDKVNTP